MSVSTIRHRFGALGAVLFLFCDSGFSEESSSVIAQGLRGGLSVADWIVVFLYMAGMIGIGVYYARRNKTADDYYFGGRKMKPFMVGVSLFATLISTISYLSVPGEIMKHGPVAILDALALPLIFVVVGFFIIPNIMKLRITSAYEILETRLGRGVRLFGSTLFLSIRLIWMALVIFSASKVVIPCLGWSPEALPYVVIILGTTTVIYAALGGLQAVVLTDVIQTFVMFGGAFLCIGIVTVRLGGFGWIPTQWSPAWDVQPVFSLDPAVRVTLFGTMVHSTVWWISTCGSDQLAIQRYLATRDAQAARRAFLYNSVAMVAVSIILGALGFALLAFYIANPQYQIGRFNIQQEADYLFPHFVVNFSGYGVAGLVISGMLAAAMSSLSSGVTSTATVLNADLIQNLIRRDLSETDKVRLGKWATAAIGVIVIILALLIRIVPGNLYEVTTKTNGLFVAPMFGLFFMAMYVPWATPAGTVLGSLYGIFAAFVVAFWDLTGGEALSFQWILASALVMNIVTGCLFSLVPTQGRSRIFKIMLIALMAMPLILAVCWFGSACYWKG